jgi:hypothetical protein
MTRARASWLVALVLLGCDDSSARDGGDDFADDVMDEPLPPKCEDTDAAACETTGPAVAECAASNECAAGEVCSAVFDGDIGVMRCEDSCIVTDDELSWCADASACCDAGASCVRGLCIAGNATSGGSESSESSGSTGETSSTT